MLRDTPCTRSPHRTCMNARTKFAKPQMTEGFLQRTAPGAQIMDDGEIQLRETPTGCIQRCIHDEKNTKGCALGASRNEINEVFSWEMENFHGIQRSVGRAIFPALMQLDDPIDEIFNSTGETFCNQPAVWIIIKLFTRHACGTVYHYFTSSANCSMDLINKYIVYEFSTSTASSSECA